MSLASVGLRRQDGADALDGDLLVDDEPVIKQSIEEPRVALPFIVDLRDREAVDAAGSTEGQDQPIIAVFEILAMGQVLTKESGCVRLFCGNIIRRLLAEHTGELRS